MTVARRAQMQMEQSSWIRRMFEEGAELRSLHGAENVFDLSLGNPLLEPPPEFREALLEIANDGSPGQHRYMPNPGYPETRQAVADGLRRETGLEFTAGEVMMTVGAAGAISVVLKALLDAGDEVVLLAPYFAEYGFYVEHANGTARVVGHDAAFLPDMDELGDALTARTRAVIINSPNNPSGAVYPASTLAALGEAVAAAESRYGTEIYIISDEPYRKLIFGGEPYPFVFGHHVRSAVATSHSKDLGLAGERIGYLALSPCDPGRAALFDACVFMLRTLGFVNAPAMQQRIVATLQDATVDVDVYRRKRDLIHGGLTELGYECRLPDGGFYLFPRSPIGDDVEFVRRLKEHLVLVVPGSGFGAPGYFRVSYCVEDAVLEGALRGFAAALDG